MVREGCYGTQRVEATQVMMSHLRRLLFLYHEKGCLLYRKLQLSGRGFDPFLQDSSEQCETATKSSTPCGLGCWRRLDVLL